MGPSALPAELALCSLVEEERTGGGVPQTEWPKQKDCHSERPCRFCFRFPWSSNSCSFPSRTSHFAQNFHFSASGDHRLSMGLLCGQHVRHGCMLDVLWI